MQALMLAFLIASVLSFASLTESQSASCTFHAHALSSPSQLGVCGWQTFDDPSTITQDLAYVLIHGQWYHSAMH
jgi:hypothetical protein